MLLIIITALLPAVILGWWIYRKDSARPEPLKQLLLAFFYGVGSTFVSVLIVGVMNALGLMVYNLETFAGAVSTALLAAAIPEELAKLAMLWLFLRRNQHYDEYLDGIVYAACVGLGFAAAENVLYLLQSDNWALTGAIRGLTAVPAHFAMACAMGYFYSKRHFGDRSRVTACCILAVPVIIHWTWDALAFSEGVLPALSVVVNILFVLLIYYLYKSTNQRIDDLTQQDRKRMTPPPINNGPGAPLPPPLPGNPPHDTPPPLA